MRARPPVGGFRASTGPGCPQALPRSAPRRRTVHPDRGAVAPGTAGADDRPRSWGGGGRPEREVGGAMVPGAGVEPARSTEQPGLGRPCLHSTTRAGGLSLTRKGGGAVAARPAPPGPVHRELHPPTTRAADLARTAAAPHRYRLRAWRACAPA